MKCERIPLPYGGAGYVDTYILDAEISYKTERNWPAMIICPGGGYLLTATKEGEGVATQFLAQGFHCFVVRYSTYCKSRESLERGVLELNENAHYPTQVLETMQVMHMIHAHAKEWHIDTNRIFAVGFSAGGHVAASLATRWKEPELLQRLDFAPEENELKLAGVVLGYPMLGEAVFHYAEKTVGRPGNLQSQMDWVKDAVLGGEKDLEKALHAINLDEHISADTCPVFIWQTAGDEAVDPLSVTRFVAGLQEHEIPCEYHLFYKGPHGLACANRFYAKISSEIDDDIAMWLPLAFNWLRQYED